MAYINTKSLRLYYEQYGQGPTLLLFSATAFTGEHWKLEQVPHFSSAYRVIIFDYRGCGRSDRPTGPYSTRMFANDALDMLDALAIEEPVHVLGHSMGGRVAQWFALDNPLRTRSLVLAATGSGQIDEEQRKTARRGLHPEHISEIFAHGWPAYNEDLLRGSGTFCRSAPDVIERFLATLRGRYGTDLTSYLRHVEARQEHETSEKLQEICTPTLVIVGSEDTDGSPSHLDTSKYLAHSIPGAEFALIPEVAHMLQIEGVEQFNDVVGEFLARH